MKQAYVFLSPGEAMAQGDETISPWGKWDPIESRYYGKQVTAKKVASVRRPIPELLEALKDALSFMEETAKDHAIADTKTENKIRTLIAEAEGK